MTTGSDEARHDGAGAQPGAARRDGRGPDRCMSSARTSARSAASSGSPTGSPREFGEDRCFDTPLAESGIVGIGRRHGDERLRPVVEMQFDAFAYPAFEQIVSHVAKMRNRTRGAVAAADGDPGAVRRRHRRRRAPLRLLRGVLRAHPGPARRRAGDRRGRVRAAARGDRRPRPGGLPGAEEALLVARRRSTCRAPAPGIGRAVVRREGTDATLDRLRAVGAGRAGGRRGRRRRRAGTWRSSTCARSCRSTTRRSARRSARPGGRWSSHEAAGFAGVGAEIAARVHRALLPPLARAGAAGHRVRHPVPAAEAGAAPPARRGPGPRRRRRPAVGATS